MIEVVIQTLRLFFKVFDEGIDVVFPSGAIRAVFVYRILEAVAKVVAFLFDLIEQTRHFAIADAIWLAGNLGCCIYNKRRQHETASNKKCFGSHSGYFNILRWGLSKATAL